MTAKEKVQYVRGLTWGLKGAGVGAQDLFDILHHDGINEGYRVDKVGVDYETETASCPFCGEKVNTDTDGDIIMALMDSDAADEVEFVEGTNLVLFGAIVHPECREESTPDETRRLIFSAGMNAHMDSVSEVLKQAEDIANGVIAKEKEEMQK